MKQNRRNVLAITICCFLGTGLFAQSNTVASGGNAIGAEGSVSYSVGQIDYIEATGTGGTANQGVQQPIEIFVLGTDEFENIILEVSVYPNPTQHNVTLRLENLNFEELTFVLYDLSGRLLQQDEITSEETLISMDGFASATYFLNIINKTDLLKTFKIIKH